MQTQTQTQTSSGLLIGGETAGEILAALLDWAAEEERRRLGEPIMKNDWSAR